MAEVNACANLSATVGAYVALGSDNVFLSCVFEALSVKNTIEALKTTHNHGIWLVALHKN